MENLYELGYDTGQISQIYKFKKLGIDIEKKINSNISSEQLRNLYIMINDEKYLKKDKNMIIKFYIEENKDIRYLIDKGFINSSQIRLALQAEEEKISIESMSNKSYNLTQMKEIFKYLKKDIDITKFIDNNIPITEGIVLEKNKIDAKDVFEKYSTEKTKKICYWLNKNINVMPHINPKYSKYQIDSIGKAILNKVDVKKVKINDLPGSVMNIIIDGLINGIDITPYLTKSTSTQKAQIIYDCLKKGIDAKVVLKYENPKISKLALKLSELEIDDSFLSKIKEHDRLRFLTQVAINSKSCPDINFKKIVDATFISERQLKEAITLMQKKCNTDALFICDFDMYTLQKVSSAILKGIDISPFITKTTESVEVNALITLLERNYIISRKE